MNKKLSTLKAAKKTNKSTFSDDGDSAPSLFSLINKFDDTSEILSKSQSAVIDEWLDTGFYILNAGVSGSIYGGIPSNRCITFAGEPGTGKTYIALSVARNAQLKGYTPLYCDSEGAIDIDTVKRIGCKPDNFIIRSVATIEDFSNFASNLVKQIDMLKAEGKPTPKPIVFLDSLGNLSSNKEKGDVIEGKDVRDMGKQQKIRAMFRIISADFARLKIPFIINSHVYAMVGSYIPGNEVSGGGGIKFNSSVIMMLSTSKLEDKESADIAAKKNANVTRVGVVVTATPKKQRFARPIKVQFHIPFFKKPNPYVGLEQFVSWEGCGVMRGKALSEKEYLKLSPKEQEICSSFEGENGEILYAYPKDTARTLVCKHLKGETSLADLFTSKVFTPEVLKQLDENVIKPTFQLPDFDSNEDIKELIDEMVVDDEDDFSDALNLE